MRTRLTWVFFLTVLFVTSGCSRAPETSQLGLYNLPRLRTFSAARTSSANHNINSNDDEKRIMPGQTLVMADLTGPGLVDHIWVTVADSEFAWPRLVRFRVYYDGEKTPSVDAPLGDFFGVGHGYEENLSSMMVLDSSFGRARNSYWAMPFYKSCKITVTNEGNIPVIMFYYHVDWQKHQSLPPGLGYFHAYYRQERPAVSGKNYEFLNIRGDGQYVGTVLSVIQSQVGWFGEGDDLFYVDGAKHPQIVGTGTEDYFNAAWGLRVTTGPWTGITVAAGEQVGARLSAYRWHVPDPIPFKKSIWAGIEHFGWTYNKDGTVRSGFEERPDLFSSVAFWYQKGVSQELPELPYGDARLPLGNAKQIAIEDEVHQVTTQRGKVAVQRRVDWGKDLLFFDAQGSGSRVNIPIDIPEAAEYELIADMATAPDYGDYYALLDGKPMGLDPRQAATSEVPYHGAQIYRNYSPEVYVADVRPLGWTFLSKGRHMLSFVCTGKDSRSSGYNLGVMDVVLEKIPAAVEKPSPMLPRGVTPEPPRELPSAASGEPVYRGLPLSAYLDRLRQAPASERPDLVRAIGAFGSDAGPGVSAVTEALHDPDAQVRSAAAWSLSQIGPVGAAAVPELAKALSDSSPRVRDLAAVALQSMGPKAAPAIPELIRALNDPVVYVRCPAADALGAIGPEARAAIQPLAKRLLVKNEEAYVLHSVTTALGDMGPGAKAALPALREARSRYRVSATIDEAIAKIEGKPVPSWW
jgi:D-arabinan exo alpha-(1,3)/(1,5)-arabinofuranosidase (non-reducing end)